MAKALCIECHSRPKWGSKHRCYVCAIRHEGITERVADSRRRGGMVPEALRKRVVPAKAWPPGTRWCGGCQTFADLEDFGKNASQCRACVSAKSHAAMVEKTYGLVGDDYATLFELQGGRCAICRQKPGKKRLAVDHDHKTGKVRGLLCSRDNHELLGAGYDSIAKLGAAVHYLENPPASGLWWAPEDGLVVEISKHAAQEGEKTPSKPSRLADPPDAYGRQTGAQSVDLAPIRPDSAYSVDQLLMVGGLEDENGRFKLYQRMTDDRPPF